MIHVVQGPAPQAFLARASKGMAELERTAEAGGYKKQRTFSFESRIWLAAREELAEASHFKCMYCESPVRAAQQGHVDQFRPKSHARGFDQADVAPDHYWWLAYEWENLLFSCQECNRAKRHRFPVDGVRCAAFADQTKEKRLLLSPYGPEDPSTELVFKRDGTVESKSERAAVTIETLALNREFLVDARREARSAGTPRTCTTFHLFSKRGCDRSDCTPSALRSARSTARGGLPVRSLNAPINRPISRIGQELGVTGLSAAEPPVSLDRGNRPAQLRLLRASPLEFR